MNISEATGGSGSRPIPPDGALAASTMKSFLNACGLREPLRIVVEGPRAAGPRTLPQPFAVIGRDSRADVMLDDERVSRRHVYLQVVAGHVFWLDLETRTGTCDETGTRKSGWLTGGGLLEIGPFVIRRAPSSDPALESVNRPGESPLVVRAFTREPLPEVALEFLNGPSQATVWPMNRVMSLIGSAQGCKFRLTDPSVSPFHASLLRTPEGLWVIDLRGGRSITVNGEPVRFRPLDDGDVLGIGRYRINIRCRESREAATGLPARRSTGEIARRPAAAAPSLAGSFMPMPMPPMPMPMPVVASASGVELVSSDAAAPGRFQPEVSESVLVPLVNQFSMMQQQMFDQFQQAMGMLLQMFGTMHREQMDVIREELDRLHDLTRELQELKEELARNPQGVSPSPAGATQPTAAPRARAATPASEIPIPPPRPAAPSSPPPRPAESPAAAESIAARSADPANPPPRPAAAVTTPPTARRPDQPAHGQLSPGARGPAPGQDTVAWIHQRIMTIQHERETRWQKILKLLPGVS